MYLISERRLPGSTATTVSSAPMPERGAARAARHVERDRAGQRMADVHRVDAALGVDLGLEREDAEDEVGGAADLARSCRRARPRSTG